jgi:hypothetical protein
MSESTNSSAGLGLGIAGLILGIISIPFGIMGCTFIMALIFGILGITLSAVAYSQARQANAPTGLIIAALIISVLGTSFALLRFTNSAARSTNFIQTWKNKIEEKSDGITINFDDAFKEGFEEEYGSDFDESMEDELESMEDELDSMEKHIEINLDNLSDEEKAERLGRATGKALREFVNEMNDSTDSD